MRQELIPEVVEIDNAGGEKGVSFRLEKHPYKGRLEGYALVTSYQRKSSEERRNKVRDTLETYVQGGSPADASRRPRRGGKRLPRATSL